ncbi:MAG: GGDEF domain-containing protein [Kangiellaceae bacterium]|nr:GGDEF domain-containing protein [Kangiellaceae bacterium]
MKPHIVMMLIFTSGMSTHDLFAQQDSSATITPFLGEDAQQYVSSQKELIVCSVAQAVGSNASIDIVKLITKNTGLNVIASKPMSWREGVNGLKQGDCDILPWATETEERKQFMNFTRPYARTIRVIVTRKEQPYIGSIEPYLHNYFVTETNNNIVAQLQHEYPSIQITRTESTLEALELVETGELFANLASLYSVSNLFGNERFSELKIAGQLPSRFDDVVSLASHKDNLLLAKVLDKAVMTTNQIEIADFMNQSAVYTYGREIDYSRYWYFGLITVILIISLLWWIRYLRALNYKLETTHKELEEKSYELEILSTTDSLTNTYNRLKLDDVFIKEIARSNRYNSELSVIMLDIDFFKNVNDEFGHIAGDQILIKFAELLKTNLRDNDILGRWGGEEFLVICTGIDSTKAVLAAEKLRKIIENENFSPASNLTASFGIAGWKKGDTEESIVARADQAMYTSKHQGRNRVTLIESTQS